MKARIDADEIVDLWSRLGPACGAATPHIPDASAPGYFAVFANTGVAASLNTWPMAPLWRS